ncbi:MAG: primosomal protein N' [Lachnospiraceae bacterium]|nr:primosomal protein N' [Lachnospiraceae bacterium]
MLYADIIVDISHESLDKTYQYKIPEHLTEQVKVGLPADITFGSGNRHLTGYIVGLSDKPKIEEHRIKEIEGLVEKGIAIESRMISLAHWMKENFGGTMNDALRTVLSVKKSVKPVEKKQIALAVDRETAEKLLKEYARKHNVARARLIKELLDFQPIPKELVTGKLNVSGATLKALEEQNIITTLVEEVYRTTSGKNEINSTRVVLNENQQKICDTICKDYDNGLRNTYLIHGVTGSGKTEVYLQTIEHIVAKGRQVIVLIPEIALTYQTVRRFTERFGNRVAFLHSRLSMGERYDQYRLAKEGKLDIMIGPRSALFTPFENLGGIVIDEEHESSYKSEQVPKYHARETAIQLAKMTDACVILGSATPSLESYEKAQQGEYVLLELKQRAKNAKLPEVEIVDLKEEMAAKNRSMFSRALQQEMAERLKRGEQTMLFLNRRGYSGSVSCRSCGKPIMCPHCSVSLTLHYDQTLHCHYCGHTIPMPDKCPECGSPYIAAFGTGTQKVEEAVKKLFPQARVLRMDADTTKEKESYEKILSSFANEGADILVGTQMIVKGHDFPKVTLVGIIAADLSLNVSDYRSSERTFQLLAQAAGRAGRDELPGKVIIQTYQPEHYSITTAAREDYSGFFRQEMSFRKMMKYPPQAHILAVLCIGRDEAKTEQFCGRVALTAKQFAKEHVGEYVAVIGPTKASVAKSNDFFRNLIYIKADNYDILTKLASALDVFREQEKTIILQMDFDPMGSY